ncbi:Tyrosine recombinase XerC [Posidoniimonas corsicana]|uniref:Tyrosine recombinase XerC n=1 Tax=Posidoniimonas corsicana TaxID=1938618 RepID=A0A5C5V5T3_9BACT|nr:site-specific integrase [Posidoniimonas corsicana]TWT33896.1 Tyrosine recombinase XerC [Posidoniimonas corsicana]
MPTIKRLTFTKYVGPDGRRVKKDAPGAKPKQYQSKRYYGWYQDARGETVRVKLSTDKTAAAQQLAQLVKRAEWSRSGLRHECSDHLETPLAEHLAAYKSHLAAKGNSERYVRETAGRLKRIQTAMNADKLGDLNLDRFTVYLNELRGGGASARTLNAARGDLKSFGKWCVMTKRLPANPFEAVSKENEAVDRRRERRVLRAKQLADLIAAADDSETPFRGLDGPNRAMLYQLAIATGLRANELATLTTASLQLEGDSPCVVVRAAYSKRRREDEQPLPTWLAEKLQAWLDVKRARSLSLAPQKLFPGSWPRRAAEMLQPDLEAADIAYTDEAGRVFDFHALRHQFITTLAAANVSPKIAQQLARHSSIELTLGRYTHLQAADVAGALDVVGDPAASRESGAATGTDDADASKELRYSCAKRVSHRPESASDGKRGDRGRVDRDSPETVARLGVASGVEAEGMGLEPTTPCGAPDFESVPACRGRTLSDRGGLFLAE